jgi:hypothetical protein
MPIMATRLLSHKQLRKFRPPTTGGRTLKEVPKLIAQTLASSPNEPGLTQGVKIVLVPKITLWYTRGRSKRYSDFTLENLSKRAGEKIPRSFGVTYAVRSKITQKIAVSYRSKIAVSYAVEQEYLWSFYSEEHEYLRSFCGLVYL